MEGTANAGLVGSSGVVRVTHVDFPSRGCEPVSREGSTGRAAARSRCGSCFTCGSRLEEIPARAKTLRNTSAIVLFLCRASAPEDGSSSRAFRLYEWAERHNLQQGTATIEISFCQPHTVGTVRLQSRSQHTRALWQCLCKIKQVMPQVRGWGLGGGPSSPPPPPSL